MLCGESQSYRQTIGGLKRKRKHETLIVALIQTNSMLKSEIKLGLKALKETQNKMMENLETLI